VANTGVYTWKVDQALEGLETMPANEVYGLMIKDDLTGLFEYSPPFQLRIPNSAFGKSTSASASSATSGASSIPSPSAATSSGEYDDAPLLATRTPEASTSIEHEIKMNGFNLEAIFGAAGAGVGAIIIMIVVFSVWQRIQSEKKMTVARKHIRNHRHSLDDNDSPYPVTPQYAAHRRIMSSSSFGDGARASDLFERSALEPPKPLSPIADSPPPTPFAAPPIVFPATAAFRRTSKGPADLHRRSSQQPQELPAALTHQITGSTLTSPPKGFTLGPAPNSHNFSQRVPTYSAFNPNTPPTRPASAAETETDTTVWGNHPT